MIPLLHPFILSDVKPTFPGYTWVQRSAQAAEYLIETRGDIDDRLVRSVHYGTRNLIETGRFQLPAPLCWIEDMWQNDLIRSDWRRVAGVSDTILPREFYMVEINDGLLSLWGGSAAPGDNGIDYDIRCHEDVGVYDCRPGSYDDVDPLRYNGTSIYAVLYFILMASNYRGALTQIRTPAHA